MGLYLLLDPDGRVNSAVSSNVGPEGAVEVSVEIFQRVSQSPRAFRYLIGENTLEDIIEAPPVILVNEIHMAWFRAALAEAGKLAAVNTAIASLGPVKQELWEYASAIRIDDPDVIAVAAALDIDLRATFDRAAEIKAERQPA